MSEIEMTDRTLVALMAAIIHGSDDRHYRNIANSVAEADGLLRLIEGEK